MKIKTLTLSNFRNYDTLKINFSEKLNLIYGNNGSGKTNLVEAIYSLALTKSFRANNDKYLIKKNENSAKIIGDILKNEYLSTFIVTLSEDGKKVEIDNNVVDRISNYISKLTIVLFYPGDTELINDSPSERRKMVNIEISQLYKEYLLILNNYNKILKQRNAYLKQLYVNGNASTEYLDILTRKLIEYGVQIYNYRKNYIEKINLYIVDIYKNIFGDGILNIKYNSDYKKNENDILKAYRNIYSREMAFGKTLLGVHHDDFEFILDDNKLKDWGSQGQKKNAIISFKLAEINLIYEVKQDYPILILDDLFSELDKNKITNILKLLDNKVQTFITTTDLKNVDKKIMKKCSVFEVKQGCIKEVNNE